MKQRQYAQHRLSALGILFLIFLPLTLPMLNIDEATGKRLIDFFIYRCLFLFCVMFYRSLFVPFLCNVL
jgi:hypothetical protein